MGCFSLTRSWLESVMARVGTANFKERIKHPVCNDNTWAEVVQKECTDEHVYNTQVTTWHEESQREGPTVSTAHAHHPPPQEMQSKSGEPPAAGKPSTIALHW